MFLLARQCAPGNVPFDPLGFPWGKAGSSVPQITTHRNLVCSAPSPLPTVPPQIASSASTVRVLERQPVSLPCVVLAGRPLPERRWLKAGLPVSAGLLWARWAVAPGDCHIHTLVSTLLFPSFGMSSSFLPLFAASFQNLLW